MRLHSVANRFNNLVCLDGYTGSFMFNGQLGLYDDNKRDSETAERRVISTAPDVVIPARRVVHAAGTRFIIGHGNPDDYLGTTIRVGHVAHEATWLSHVRTLAQVCLDQLGFTAYAGRAWIKDVGFSEHSSREVPEYHIHFARNEPVRPNLLVDFEGRLNVVRAINYGSGGTLVATCEELPEPAVEQGALLVSTYDPVQDTRTGTTISVKVVRMRWQSLFEYSNSIAPKFQPGDIQVAIARQVVNVTPEALLTLGDGVWQIKNVATEGGVWLCRASRHE